jgi:hypothetical protein
MLIFTAVIASEILLVLDYDSNIVWNWNLIS